MLGFAGPFSRNPARETAFDTMLRQFHCKGLLAAALIAAMLAGVGGCGIKGPRRPAPKATATPPPPPIDNPATPPRTTSPALPPPSSTTDRQP
jgi:predicted small lipoprotein YifL